MNWTIRHLLWLTFVAAVIMAAYANLSAPYLWTWGVMACFYAVFVLKETDLCESFWFSFGGINACMLVVGQVLTVSLLVLVFVMHVLFGSRPPELLGQQCSNLFHCWWAVSLSMLLNSLIGLSYSFTEPDPWYDLRDMFP